MHGEMTAHKTMVNALNGTGEMAIMDETGDTKVIWDSTKEAEVEAARAQFNTLRKKGYVAFKVSKKGEKAEMLTEFDPEAEKIILAPANQGG